MRRTSPPRDSSPRVCQVPPPITVSSRGLGTCRLPGARAAGHGSSVFPATLARSAASAGTGCVALPGLAYRCLLPHKCPEPGTWTRWKIDTGQERAAVATAATRHHKGSEVWGAAPSWGCLCCHVCTSLATRAGLRRLQAMLPCSACHFVSLGKEATAAQEKSSSDPS